MKSFVIVAAIVLSAGAAAAQDSMSHAHMGHVMTEWGDTPDNKGLLPVARAEADVARAHIGYALSDPSDLGAIQTHVRHALHAVDPTLEASGPGLGYGLTKAAKGVVHHVEAAAASEGASENVTMHAEHAASTAGNVAKWSAEIAELSQEALAADTAEAAAATTQRIQMLLGCVTDGCDADGDGSISWGPGEGGLAQAEHHMEVMMSGENMMMGKDK